ncbi:MAG: glycosyltransferase [Actinobacteria bacterium HGW-Actinobacteria-1]|jgi:N-acetylglucosaminyldiphosphoundecaprenol N-acetyl-beta-D-mannosaminyltransferase|nr:MAG: glycosyltransferase [Actinobacteria bacterium HGW-Actinobacteria-1]
MAAASGKSKVKTEIFGVTLDMLTMDQSVERCTELIEIGQPAQHVVINAGKVAMMHDKPHLKEIISRCQMVNADGQSVVWASRLKGHPVPERVAGIDLMHKLLERAEQRGWPTYFLGAREEVLQACLAAFRIKYPELVVAGYQHGYFSDDKLVAQQIREAGTRLLFVGISSPKKEEFLSEHLKHMGPVFAMGVGGSFDVVAGLTKRAPLWMQKSGLEWAYRLGQEPGRMWKRYLFGNARFINLVIKEERRRVPRN